MKRWKALAALALLTSQTAQARQDSAIGWCRAHPERIGQCRQIRGRLTAYNGTPTYRIWVVGTQRGLGLAARNWREAEEGGMLPSNVRAALGRRPFQTLIYANFEICPLERQRPGWMQHVCVARATRLHVVRP